MSILVINPNSSQGVTDGLVAALAPYGPHFDCVTMAESPATIATNEDVARAGLRVLEIAREARAEAVITACFSDPGLDLMRSEGLRAFGIQECGILTAMARADRFGIIALSPKSIPRHMARMRQMGVLERLAGEVGLSGVSALDAGTSDAVLEETLEAGGRLVAMGAGAIVLGCAGFAPRRRLLEDRLGVPVIDPVQAAAVMALGTILG